MQTQQQINKERSELESLIESYVSREVQRIRQDYALNYQKLVERVDRLESLTIICSDEEALLKVKNCLAEMKKKGIKKFDIIDLHEKLKLPLSQLQKLLSELKASNTIRDLDE